MVETSKRIPMKTPEEPRPQTTAKPVTAPKTRAEQAAARAAHKAAKTEQEFDQNHTTISK